MDTYTAYPTAPPYLASPAPPTQLPPQPPSPERPPPRRKHTRWFVSGIAATALLCGGGGAAAGVTLSQHPNVFTATAASQTASTVVSPAGADTVASVAAKVTPSVVTIEAIGAQSAGTGSGVIIRSDGLVLTNNHVVSTVPNGKLTVVLADGRRVSASIVGTDPSSDLAVIQLDGVSGLPAATFADSDALTVGQLVVAIGSPLGLDGTVTSGVVSALHRAVLVSGEQANNSTSAIDAIQTDTAINPGNSGGPLLDAQGQVIGINSAIATVSGASGGQQSTQSGNIGVGFAIPSNTARDVATQLIDTGTVTHPMLGVQASDYANQNVAGAQVRTVEPGSAAASAGLQAGDVVLDFGGRNVDGVDSLAVAVRSFKVGSVVPLTYLRDGQQHTVSVTLTAAPASH